MSFIGLFQECDYSYYVIFLSMLQHGKSTLSKFKKEVSDFKTYFGLLTLFNRMCADIFIIR